ncbi:MAG: sugar phosphate nucleotidyltransferase [Chloroflexota bacterium]|nr:sugar phosphate nucleotidyltransferase [Chloroflexota bacterium]
MQPTLIVMAAGMGSRYGGLKQIDPVGPHGEKIIDYSIYDALQAGFDRVIFVIKEELVEIFRAEVGRNIERVCATEYVYQRLTDIPANFTLPPARKKPWGTAHAVYSCRQVVKKPFAVINADDFYGRGAYQLLSTYLQQLGEEQTRHNYSLVGYRLSNTVTAHGYVSRGVCTVQDGLLVKIDERLHIEQSAAGIQYQDGGQWHPLPADATVSMNMWGFTPSLFDEMAESFPRFLAEHGTESKAEYFLPAVAGELVRADKATIRVLETDERWIGVTYRKDKPQVKRAIQELAKRGVYPAKLWEEA